MKSSSKDDATDKVASLASRKSLKFDQTLNLPSSASSLSNATPSKSILVKTPEKASSGTGGHARKSVSLAVSSSPHADDASVPPRIGSLSERSGSDHSVGSPHSKRTRTKSFIVMNHRPVAVFMESETEPESTTDANPTISKPSKPPATPADKPKTRGHKGVRTFRIWSENQRRKSITVKVGDKEGEDEAEKIFETSQMRHKTFHEWHRQAKSRLPSVSGGPAVGNVADIINMSPTLQKEGGQTVENTIRRLSLETEMQSYERRKSSVKVDYTKFRIIPPKKDEDSSSSSDEDDEDDENDDEITIDIITTDEEEERFRQLQAERKKAGQDIKDKIKSLRELGEHLSNKRKVRQELVAKATGIAVLDTEQIPIKEQILYFIEEFGAVVHDLIAYFVIWKKQIREINGRFGIVIASYFIWLRQMIAMEVFAFVVTNGFIIIPQILEDVGDPNPESSRVQFGISDLINGEGYFHHSYLYYSGYKNRNEESPNPFHNPAFRFVFCMLFMFMVLTYFIFSRLTRYYQSVRMESKVSGVAHMDHFKAIICGWDFSCRDPEAKIYIHKTICREMYVLAKASEQSPGMAVVEMEIEHKRLLAFAVKRLGLLWGPWAIHVVGNLVIVVACVVLGLILVELCQLKLLYYVSCISLRDNITHTENLHLHHDTLCPNGDPYLHTWILSFPTLFASMTTLLLTKFILIVGDNETWNTPERKIYATMIRAGIFNFTNIGVFYTFWIRKKNILRDEGFVAETIFGKELYRLVVLQGLMDVVLNFGVKGLYHLIRRKRKGYVMTEFRTEYCSLSMFFIHSVSRIGVLFCPPLSIFVALRLVLDFYQNRFALLRLSAKESYSAHASHVYGPFLLTFFILCYLITSFMNVYYITETMPSDFNGPFLTYKESYDEVLGRLLNSDAGVRWLRNLTQPGFLVTFNAILLALLYFCREWGRAYEPIIEYLNDHITMERADRELLLKAIFEIGQVTSDSVKGRSSKMQRKSYMKAVDAIAPNQPSETDLKGTQKDLKVEVGREDDPLAALRRLTMKLPGIVVTQPPVEPPTRTVPTSPSVPSIRTAATTSAPQFDAETLERQIDEEISQLIHTVKTRRRSILDPWSMISPAQHSIVSHKNEDKQRPGSIVSSAPNAATNIDRKKIAERRRSMKALEEKAMHDREAKMHNILDNIVENRRKMMRGAGLTVGKLPPTKSGATVAPSKQNVKPPTLEQQLNQLSIAKIGTVNPAKSVKSRGSVHAHHPPAQIKR